MMGGYFSTRWGWERTRQDTDPLLKLDVRVLHRQGALQPSAVATQFWTRRGEPAGDIMTRTNGDASILTLSYRVTDRSTGEREVVHEDVSLEPLENTLGGRRVWFRCPGCDGRCAVLFCRAGCFRCRRCHDLAYTSTREDELDRNARRIRMLQRRLYPSAECDLWDIPAKPPHMQWRTYQRVVSELLAAIIQREALFASHFRALVDRFDQ